MNSERLRRLRNIQSWSFYESLIMRPLAIAALYPMADWKFLSPNLLTSIGNLFKLLGAYLIYSRPSGEVWGAFTALQVGVLFDHMDGTLARYQERWSALGSFYDKVSDLVTWTPIVLAIAHVEAHRRGDALPWFLAAVATNGQAAMGYSKWLAKAEAEKLDWYRARDDNGATIATKTKAPKIEEPPERSFSEWSSWALRMFRNAFAFQEIDLFLWVGVLLLLNQYMLALWALVVLSGGAAMVMIAVRLWHMKRLDEKLTAYR